MGRLTVVFLVLIYAACIAAQCSSHTTCSQCIPDGACGWCAVRSQCMEGGPLGPSNPATPCTQQYWLFGGQSRELSRINGFPVNPVHFNVYLYPKSPLNLVVRVTNPERSRVPLDLFFIQDLSGSFTDDIITVRALAPKLVADVLSYQPYPRFGLASFDERPKSPMGIPSQGSFNWPANAPTDMMQPCPKRDVNSGPWNWGFCLELGLTNNYNLLQTAYTDAVVHENGDWPEPSMDGLMFSAVCPIPWRDDARKIVMVLTDAGYQVPRGPPYPTTEGAFARANNYDCVAEADASGIPGTLEDYAEESKVRDLLALKNIVPIIGSARALPEHDDFPMWQTTINGWGFGTVLELATDSSNFIEIIRTALADLSTNMTMKKTSDPELQVEDWLPKSYSNVGIGESRYFQIKLLKDTTINPTTIEFTVVGFGIVTINVTNSLPCIGCDGVYDSNAVVDLCGECQGTNDCVGCDGVAYSGTAYDACGICAGDGLNCSDCEGTLFGTAKYDACGDCNGNNDKCKGCDNVLFSNKTYDDCGVCDGNNTCRGCDGILNSNVTFDICGVCNGTNLTCAILAKPAVQPVPIIVGGIAGFIVLAVIAGLIIFAIAARIAKTKFDQYQYMQNQQVSAVGTNPMYDGKGGWQANALNT